MPVDNPERSITTHILLADDSPDAREPIATMLRLSGYEVSEVNDGKQTIEYLKSKRVDALLLDLQMPGVDGFAVLNYLNEHRRALPVMLLSGMPIDSIQRKMHVLHSGELPPLLLKPIDLNQMLNVLELQLSGELPAG